VGRPRQCSGGVVPRAWEYGCTGCILLDAGWGSMLRAGGLARPGRHGCDMPAATATATTTRRGTAYAAWAREWRGKVGMEQRLRCLRWVHSDAATQRHGRQRIAAQRMDGQIAAVHEGRRFAFACFAILLLYACIAEGQQRRCSEPRAAGPRDADMQTCSSAATHRSATVPRVGLHSVVLGSVTRRVVGCGAPYPWPLDQMARQARQSGTLGPGDLQPSDLAGWTPS
jgi:hypothetical protein